MRPRFPLGQHITLKKYHFYIDNSIHVQNIPSDTFDTLIQSNFSETSQKKLFYATIQPLYSSIHNGGYQLFKFQKVL